MFLLLRHNANVNAVYRLVAAGRSIKSTLIVVHIAVTPDRMKALHVTTQLHVLVTTLQTTIAYYHHHHHQMVFLKWPKQQHHHEDHYSQSKYKQYQSVL